MVRKLLALAALTVCCCAAQIIQLPQRPATAANTIRSGQGRPANTLGIDGDWYIDTTPPYLIMYGPKASGAWPTVGTSLIGPPGSGSGGSTGTINEGAGGQLAYYAGNGITLSGRSLGAPDIQSAGGLLISNNLSDLGSVATARTNLGLGSSATQAATAFDAAGAATAAQSAAQTFAANANNLSSGTVPAARLPLANSTTAGAVKMPTNAACLGTTGNVPVAVICGGSSSGLGDPGSNGIVARTALNTTVAVARPAGNIVGDSDTQTLTNKSIDASEITTGTFNLSLIPALNQDTSGNAATATALAATPTLCPGGEAPTGILANGNATGCASISGGSGGASTPATTDLLKGTGAANGVAAATPNTDYLIPASPPMTGTPTVNGNAIGAFRVSSLPSSCTAGTDSAVIFSTGGVDAVYTCDDTGHYVIPPGGSTTVLTGDVNGTGSANTVTKIGGVAVGNLATQSAPSSGIVKSSGTALSSVAAPAGAIVGTTDTQTLTNKSIAASEINSGTLSAARMPAFTGDVSTASGAVSTTLATVNSDVGTFGDAGTVPQITVDGKGRITGVALISITGGGSGMVYPSAGIGVSTGSGWASSITAPSGAIVGTSDTQTLTNKSIDASEINSGIFSSARIPTLNQNTTGNAATATSLAATPSLCASGQAPRGILANGAATGCVSIGSGGGGSLANGALTSLPATCSVGTLYFVTDQPAGQQLYTCSATNTWIQMVNLGGSGALMYTGGSLDINPAVLPTLASAAVWTGLSTFQGGIDMLTANSQPACNSGSRGTLWYVNGGSSKDSFAVCAYNGTAYAWQPIY